MFSFFVFVVVNLFFVVLLLCCVACFRVFVFNCFVFCVLVFKSTTSSKKQFTIGETFSECGQNTTSQVSGTTSSMKQFASEELLNRCGQSTTMQFSGDQLEEHAKPSGSTVKAAFIEHEISLGHMKAELVAMPAQ